MNDKPNKLPYEEGLYQIRQEILEDESRNVNLMKLENALIKYQDEIRKTEPFVTIHIHEWIEKEKDNAFAELLDIVYGIDDYVYIKYFSYNPICNERPHTETTRIEYNDFIAAAKVIKQFKNKRDTMVTRYLLCGQPSKENTNDND